MKTRVTESIASYGEHNVRFATSPRKPVVVRSEDPVTFQVSLALSRFTRNFGMLARCVGLALALLLLQEYSQAEDLDPKLFALLVSDLDSNNFSVRHKTTEKLVGYCDPKSNVRLTVAQLQTLRGLAGGIPPGTSLEVQFRAGNIIRRWANLNPKTTQPASDLLNGLKMRDWEQIAGDQQYKIGEVEVSHSAAGIEFTDMFVSAYWGAVNQYNRGLTAGVGQSLRDMSGLVKGLKPPLLQEFVFRKGDKYITKDDFFEYLDQQRKTADDLLKKVNDSIGDPPPPAKKVGVNGPGQIGDSKTFQIALNGGIVKPGAVTFLDLPCSFSLTKAPMGLQFIGPIFDLSADESLEVDGGSINVSFTYGDPTLLGLPISQAAEFQLVRFADAQYQPLLFTHNDTNNFLFTGVYDPPAPASGLDPFGEFAIVAPSSQLKLGDGLINFLLNGNGTNQINALIPQQFCNDSSCNMAQGSATGTGNLQSSGTYTVSSPSDAPSYLVPNDDGSFTVTQTDQIQLNYYSPQGTLTGLVQVNWVSGTDTHLHSAVIGTLTVTGGTFANYFPNGSNVKVTLGFTGDPSILLNTYGFVAAEFQDGRLDPGCAEQVSNSSSW